MTFNSIVLVFEHFSEEYVGYLFEPLDPIIFVVNDLELEHAVSKIELYVLWVNTLDDNCRLLYLNETVCYLGSLALDYCCTKVLLQELSPEIQSSEGRQAFIPLKLQKCSR